MVFITAIIPFLTLFGTISSAAPLNPRQSNSKSITPYSPPSDLKYAEVFFTACGDTDVSRVLVGPCEGGSGAEGDACVFTSGQNYTIVIEYTSTVDATSPRAGLASFDGDKQTAYSGQSFDACRYTACPIQANVQANYTYYFVTLLNPEFDRLLFNATNELGGDSFMCADIPMDFVRASSA